MVMTTVMVLVDSSPHGRCAINAAFLAARRDGGHVVGVYPVPPSERLTPETIHRTRASLGIQGEDFRTMLDRAEREGGAGVEAGRLVFEEAAAGRQAVLQEKPPNPGHLTAYFKTLPAGSPEEVAEQGRIFDLVVVPQPREDPGHRVRKFLRAVLFQAGRPILVVPPKEISTLGRRPLIAWNGSALSARAAAIARNYFETASEVGILSIRTKSWSGPTAENLADYAAWHDISPRVIEVDQDGRRLSDVLFGEAEKFEADLLVMGAYSQSPFRESLTGGITNHVLSHSEFPMLMTH
jgi:nucleotide-binding universal stress UspA family protein